MLLKLHIVTVYLSYIAFLVASIAAVSYLIQNSALKNKQTGVIFSRLLNLSFLDKLNYRSIGLGFPILTLSIFCGFLWSKNVHGIYWGGGGYNSRQLFSIVIWLIYAVILHIRLSAKMRGRKVAFLSIFAFFIVIFSLFGSCPQYGDI